MVRFYAAIRRDLISILKFPFLSHFQDFSCEISLVCCLKYPYKCFSSQFLFSYYSYSVVCLFLFFLVTVISLSLLFFNVVFDSLYRCIEAILNAGMSSSSFFSRQI